MKILVHVRPYSKQFFLDVAVLAFGDSAQIVTFSEFRKCGDKWEGAFTASSSWDAPLPAQVTGDVISRDRYLRSISRENAERIVRRFWHGMEQLFDTEHFDFVLLHPVDCHVQDICERVARSRGVPCMSFVGSFLGGYGKLTLRGEAIDIRDNVESSEIDTVLAKLCAKNFLPDSEKEHVKSNAKDVARYFWRRKLIENIYNPILRAATRDWDNQQYGTLLVGKRRFSDLYCSDYDDLFSRVSDIDVDASSVYLPLHYVPEQTTDYFCKNIAALGYDRYIFSIIDQSVGRTKFLVKEHPAMFGKRSLSFYEQLKGRKNVRIIHPLDSSLRLLEEVDTVLVDNGTVGVESLIRGKRVIALEDSYYSNLHPNLHRVDGYSDDLLDVPLLDDYPNEKFVRDLLRQLFPSDFVADKHINRCDPAPVAVALNNYFFQMGAIDG